MIDRGSVLSSGLSEQAIQRLVRKGHWKRLNPRAYVSASTPVTWTTRLAAVQSWLGSDCVFSHRTAGALLGLDGVPPNFVEVVTHSGRRAEGVIVHRLARSDRPRRIHAHGFPVTNAERTICDLFSVLSPKDATLALEDAFRRRLTSIDRMWTTYSDLARPGRNGSASLRSALLAKDAADGSLASRMESMFRRILRDIPGPDAIPQFPIETEGGRFYVDFAYPDVKLALEAHSIRWHLGTDRAKRDLVRDRWLKRKGWTVLYYSWDDLRFRPNDTRVEIMEVRRDLERRLF